MIKNKQNLNFCLKSQSYQYQQMVNRAFLSYVSVCSGITGAGAEVRTHSSNKASLLNIHQIFHKVSYGQQLQVKSSFISGLICRDMLS